MLLFVVSCLFSTNAFAYNALIDGIYYNFNGDKAEVTYKNSSWNSYTGDVVIPESVVYNATTYSVTSIGSSAFYKCSGLTSVTIPNSVTSIEGIAFYKCSGLTSVTIPNSVTSIGSSAFSGCSGLSSVTIGNSVTSIGNYAFEDCTGLKKIVVPDIAAWCGIEFGYNGANPLYYAKHLYSDETTEITNLIIPNSVKSIGDGAFHACSALTSVTIPNSVTSIGNDAFFGCSGLTSVTIPNSVTSIGSYAFYNCSGLTSVTIPNSVTSIGNYAFYNCHFVKGSFINNSTLTSNTYWEATIHDIETTDGLLITENAVRYCRPWATTIIIPNFVTNIVNEAFNYNSSLTSIKVEAGNTIYDSRGNCNAIIETTTNTLIQGCKNTIIPNSVTSIGERTFYNCSGLTSVTIPNSVTSIGEDAFYNCSGLTSVTIPNSVTSIGEDAFYNCSGLTSVTIPNSVTSIESGTFRDCSGLTSVTIPNSVTSIGHSAFNGCSGLTSVTIPNSVTSIGTGAFYACKLRNVLIKCATPPEIDNETFSNQTLYHATLYVPSGSWDAYAYSSSKGWYQFINIRETATTEEQVAMQQAYTLMDANTFTYSVYDPVNNCIGTIKSVSAIDENNPNHSWQVITDGSRQYLYNLGAKKFATNGTDGRLVLTAEPTPIDMENGDNGIVLGSQAARQWALVGNDRLSVEQDIITGIDKIANTQQGESISYDLQGRRISKAQKGINIIRNADGTTKKVLIKH